MRYYVYDIEFYPDIFCVGFKEFKEGSEMITFEISSRIDERKELLKFLNSKITLIGYNNLHYDYPVLHHLIKNQNISLIRWFRHVDNNIINSDDFIIWESQHLVPQIDLYKIWHYDNKARRTSLKYLQFTLRWDKMRDLPFQPAKDVGEKNFDDLINYMYNDIDTTYMFAEKTKDKMRFRHNMSKALGVRAMNFSDVKIGETLNLQVYCELSGRKKNEFWKQRTRRYKFDLADLIPEVVEYKTPKMQEFLTKLSTKWFTFESPFEEIITFQNVPVKMGKGGLHSEDGARLVRRKEGYILKEMDIASMYPRGIVVDQVYPEHLGIEWCKGIEKSYNHRANVLKPKLKTLPKGSKEHQLVADESEAYKLAMNGGGFGKTGSMFSWQNDANVLYKITIGGQLKFMMLLEQLEIHDIPIVSVNTDGVVVHYKEEDDDLVKSIMKEWEHTTGFVLEDTYYRQIVFSNVNNYLADIVDEEGNSVKVKYKGAYDFDPEHHKNNSQRIIPITLKRYYIDGIPIKDTIRNIGLTFTNTKGEDEQTSIYDYCIGRKKTKACEYYSVVKGVHQPEKGKVLRYFISKTQNMLLKKYTGGKNIGRFQKINKGFGVTMFMDYFTSDNYNIDYAYYENECRKIIEPIRIGTIHLENPQPEQIKMF